MHQHLYLLPFPLISSGRNTAACTCIAADVPHQLGKTVLSKQIQTHMLQFFLLVLYIHMYKRTSIHTDGRTDGWTCMHTDIHTYIHTLEHFKLKVYSEFFTHMWIFFDPVSVILCNSKPCLKKCLRGITYIIKLTQGRLQTAQNCSFVKP
jgi:hypothetical protein